MFCQTNMNLPDMLLADGRLLGAPIFVYVTCFSGSLSPGVLRLLEIDNSW